MKALHKTCVTTLEKGKTDRTVTARISTISVDRDGDVMLPSGIDTREFEKNPVVLFGHDSNSIPIGKATSITKGSKDVVAQVAFAKRPEAHPAALEWVPDTIHDLFKQKILNAFSVGFTIDDAREAGTKDVERFGEGVRRIISRWKLLEFSVVPIPANQDALALAVSKGFCPDSGYTFQELSSHTGFLDVGQRMLEVAPPRMLEVG